MAANDDNNSAEDIGMTGSEREREPSLRVPTREYLRSLTKIDLQKHCRELGLSEIWVTKPKLIEKIMDKTNENRADETLANEENDISNDLLRRILEEVNELKREMKDKDQQIRELTNKLDDTQEIVDGLYGRITVVEERMSEESTNRNMDDPSPPEKTLLLGDTNLSKILRSDLVDSCKIRTINEANIDLLRCWVNEKLNWNPVKAVLYCGMSDVIADRNVSDVIDGLGTLVASLKEKNEAMEIFICELVPDMKEEALQSKVKDFNRKLIEWGYNNQVNIIKTDLPFKLGTGEIDELCFMGKEVDAPLTFNRYGAIRLLSTIIKQYPYLDLCVDLEQIRDSMNRKDSDNPNGYDIPNNETKGTRLKRGRVREQSNRIIYRLPLNSGVPHGNQSHPSRPHPRHSNPAPHPRHSHPAHYPRHSHPAPHSHHSHPAPHPQPLSYSHPRSDSRERYPLRYRNEGQNWPPCLNCGERNHKQENCFYNHRIRCGTCKELGHKSKLCVNQNHH